MPLQRANAILSAIKGRGVPAPVAEELASDLYAAEYGDAPLQDANGNLRAWDDLSDAEKDTYYINSLRKFHRDMKLSAAKKVAIESAEQQADSAARAKLTADLGADE